jgi:glycopeptide antibiotics resistance protein
VIESSAALFALPFVALAVVWWGRRRGLSWARVAADVMLAAALLAVVSQAVLPLSLRSEGWGRVDGFPTFVPFETIRSYLSEGLVDVEVRQLLGNVALFVPFGFALPLAARSFRTPLRAVAAGASLSAGVELLQMLLPGHGPDIDDVILNTLGTAVGYLGYRVLASLVASARDRTGPRASHRLP